jgi:hypothetical protein
MRHYTGDELLRLRRDHPMFEIWVVYRAIGGVTWHARPLGLEKPVYTADSPEELEDKLADLS